MIRNFDLNELYPDTLKKGESLMPFSSLLQTSRAASVPRIVATMLGALLPLVVVGIVQASAAGASSTGAQDFATIDRYVQKELEARRLPGASLGIVKADKIVHLKGFSEADPSGWPVTPQIPFLIGSTTKSFTALAIMQLVEDDKVELDAPVQRYIPWFRVADPDASKRITVRHLLNQTSGLSTASGSGYIAKENTSAEALEDEVRGMRDAELKHPPGETYQYSNLNYTTLGLIVQMVSGETYEQYVQQHVLEPLRMEDSFMWPPEAERHGLATGHQYWFGRPFSGGGLADNRAAIPAGLMASSAQDMSHYLIAHLNGGRYEGTQLLSAEGIAELHRGTAEMGGGSSYAMGWVEGEIGGVPVVWHNGDTQDFHADMFLAPKSSWGVVLLMNGSNDLRLTGMDGVANGVIARLVGVEPPPPPGLLQEPVMLQLLLVVAVAALQVAGIVRSVVLLRRWRTHPARRPRGVIRIGLRLGLPMVLNLGWLWVILNLTAGFSTDSLTLLASADVGWVALVSGGVALLWGVILRPVLALLALRAQGAPGGSDTSAESGAWAKA